MQVSNIFEFYFSINYKQDNISNGRVWFQLSLKIDMYIAIG